jgi:hypothetical protein
VQIADAEAPLQAAAGPQLPLKLVVEIAQRADGSMYMAASTVPKAVVRAWPADCRNSAATRASKAKAAWEQLTGDRGPVNLGVTAGTATYDRWMRPIVNFAEQRDVACLFT